MATQEITIDNLDSTIDNNDIVFLDFWAGWCGPCKMFEPVFEKAAETHKDIVFGKIDTEAQQEIAAALEIQSIPTLMAFKGGTMVFSQPGALPAAALEQVIAAVRDLDVEAAETAAEVGIGMTRVTPSEPDPDPARKSRGDGA